MEKLTEKEKSCLLEYTNDLKELMKQDCLSIVSDNRHSYTLKEIEELSRKVNIIND